MTTCGVTAQIQQPSFDCAKASNTVEHLICDNNQLADLDVQLSGQYKKALQQTVDRTATQQEQIAWMKNVRNICDDVECIDKAYSTRLDQLNEVQINPLDSNQNETTDSTNTPQPEEVIADVESSQAHSSSDTTASSIGTEAKEVSIPVSNSSSVAEVNTDKNQAVKDGIPEEKPDAGSISSIATAIHGVLVSLFVIGMFNPAWILRWDAKPSRKKLFAYCLPVGLLISGIAEYTKSSAAKVFEQKAKIEKQAEGDRILASREEQNRHSRAKQKGKELWDLFKSMSGNQDDRGINETNYIQGELLDTCHIGGKYTGYYGWFDFRRTFLNGIPLINNSPTRYYVFIADYGDKLSGVWHEPNQIDEVLRHKNLYCGGYKAD